MQISKARKVGLSATASRTPRKNRARDGGSLQLRQRATVAIPSLRTWTVPMGASLTQKTQRCCT